MRLPTITGLIDRRILANYRIDAQCMANVLPSPFRPWLYRGNAIGGICLIRLKHVRPKFFPLPWGIGSENAAHRIAVEWDVDGKVKRGVYIPRRDTDSMLNAFAGGRIFPGVHHHATFAVVENDDRYSVAMHSREDGNGAGQRVKVVGTAAAKLNSSSVFESLESVSEFFELGSLGYSDTRKPGKFDGLELSCKNWNVEPLDVHEVSSSYFEDESRFPQGSVEFDCALLMRGIDHEWHGRADLCCSEESVG